MPTFVPTIESLIPPVAPYPYFQGVDTLFDADAHDYSPVNAWCLAEASLLVYGSAEFVQEKVAGNDPVRRAGVQIESFASASDAAGFIMHNDRVAIAVFRGTRVPGLQDPLAFARSLQPSFRDIITDVRFLQVPFMDRGSVHGGFAQAFDSVATGVLGRLTDLAAAGRSIWFTGHSLGGAIATLAAARFGPQRFRALYTFGSPRVGDAAFAATFSEAPCFRIVHHDDIVARLPPPFLPGFPPARYAHLGRLIYIDRDGSVTVDADVNRLTDIFEGIIDWSNVLLNAADLLRDGREILKGGIPSKLTDVLVPRGPVTDHAPIYYATLLKDRLTAAVA